MRRRCKPFPGGKSDLRRTRLRPRVASEACCLCKASRALPCAGASGSKGVGQLGDEPQDREAPIGAIEVVGLEAHVIRSFTRWLARRLDGRLVLAGAVTIKDP